MEAAIDNRTGANVMLDLPETLDDLRLQLTFFNAPRLVRRRAQELDQRYVSQVQPAVRLLKGRKEKDLSRLRALLEGVNPTTCLTCIMMFCSW